MDENFFNEFLMGRSLHCQVQHHVQDKKNIYFF